MQYAGEYIDIARMADDLGSQKAPLISPDNYREVVMPAHQKIVNHIRSLKPDIKIVYHCDGSIREFLPYFIKDVGFDCWNPVQVSAEGMDDTAWLKETYGDKITFWGAGCDSQQVIAKCTPDEIRAEVRRRINDLAAGGGLNFQASFLSLFRYFFHPNLPDGIAFCLFHTEQIPAGFHRFLFLQGGNIS